METTWLDDQKKLPFAQLDRDITVDVAIVGGGITGITAAYLLSTTEKSVAVLDKRGIGEGTTAYTTAFITQYIDLAFSEQKQMFDDARIKLVWESHGTAINLIEEIIKKEKIDCGFMRCPAIIYANNEKEGKQLKKEATIAKKLGLDISLHEKDDLGFAQHGYLRVNNQGKFHPLAFLHSLAKKTAKDGVQIYANTKVEEIEEKEKMLLRTEKGTVTADIVMSATHLPFHKHMDIFAQKGKYVSYILESRLPKNTVPEAVYWDLGNPYHYFRIDRYPTHDRLIIGGEDHRADIPVDAKKNYAALKTYMKKMFPQTKSKIVRQWDGSIIETADGLAYIGELRDNYFLATGHSGNGMTYGVIAAMMMRDYVLGNKNPWTEIYNPKRIASLTQILSSTWDYTEEFINGAVKNTFSHTGK